MHRAPPRKYEFPSNTLSTGGLKIWPFGLNLLMKLKFQRSFWNQNGQISYKYFLQVYTRKIIGRLVSRTCSKIGIFSALVLQRPPPLDPGAQKKSDFGRNFVLEVNYDVKISAQACVWIRINRILHYSSFKWNFRAKIGKFSCKNEKNRLFYGIFADPAHFGHLVVAFKKF